MSASASLFATYKLEHCDLGIIFIFSSRNYCSTGVLFRGGLLFALRSHHSLAVDRVMLMAREGGSVCKWGYMTATGEAIEKSFEIL